MSASSDQPRGDGGPVLLLLLPCPRTRSGEGLGLGDGTGALQDLAQLDALADQLSQTYGALEARVREKTAELERSNRSLALLYEVAHRLSGPGPARSRRPPIPRGAKGSSS